MLEKRVLTILELNWNQRLGHREDKIEQLSSYAHVVYATVKQVISRGRKNENVCEMSKDKKCTCKACKNIVFHCQICKFVGFLLPSSSWLLKLPNNVSFPSFFNEIICTLVCLNLCTINFIPATFLDVWSFFSVLFFCFPSNSCNWIISVKVCSLAQFGRLLFCIRVPLRVACIKYRFHCVALLFGILHLWKAALWKMF